MATLPDTLLPPSSAPLERAVASLLSQRLAAPRIVPTLWDADTCPAVLLPYLAWSLSVDEWDHGWSVQKKRDVIKAAREIHQRKGTPLAIRRSLASVGHPDADLIERADCIRHNGAATRSGTHRRRGLGGWPSMRIILKRPVTVDQAQMISRLIASTKRNCVELLAIDYSQAALRRNGMAARNAAYTRGIVNT